MQPESNNINNIFRLNTKIVSALFWFICQVFFLGITLYALTKVSSSVEPLYVSDSLLFGTEQFGWPLSYFTEVQDDPNGDGMDISAFLFDFILFYIIIRVFIIILKKVSLFVIKKYRIRTYLDIYVPYIRFIIALLVVLLICCWIIYMYIENVRRQKMNYDPAVLNELMMLNDDGTQEPVFIP